MKNKNKQAIPQQIRRFSNTSLENGDKLGRGRYTILKRISNGGFGVVYSAVSKTGQVVAIKEFLPSSLPCRQEGKLVLFDNNVNKDAFEKILEVFFTEAEVASGIQTNNIVNIIDMFRENNTAYLVMPLEVGESLLSLMSRYFKVYNTRVPDNVIRSVFISITDAVKTLHEHGLLHLDIKPANIWIRPNQEVVLLDLGACRSIQHYKDFPQPMKTTGYASPEQHKPIKNTILTTQTDIYSIAATMYACIEGAAPPSAISRSEYDEKITMLRAGQVNHHLLKMIDKGMSIDPHNRYTTALEMNRELILMNELSGSADLTNYFDNRLWYAKRDKQKVEKIDSSENITLRLNNSAIVKNLK